MRPSRRLIGAWTSLPDPRHRRRHPSTASWPRRCVVAASHGARVPRQRCYAELTKGWTSGRPTNSWLWSPIGAS